MTAESADSDPTRSRRRSLMVLTAIGVILGLVAGELLQFAGVPRAISFFTTLVIIATAQKIWEARWGQS